jgi:hypothetical protein
MTNDPLAIVAELVDSEIARIRPLVEAADQAKRDAAAQDEKDDDLRQRLRLLERWPMV